MPGSVDNAKGFIRGSIMPSHDRVIRVVGGAMPAKFDLNGGLLKKGAAGTAPQ
jgi:hypothetical protein